MFKINSAKLVRVIAKKMGFTISISELYLDALIESIIEALSTGDNVKIHGFGIFETRIRQEKIGRNPSTKEKKIIPRRRVPAFKPGKIFKEAIRL